MDFIIKKATKSDATKLDELLTMLIQYERNYDDTINESFKVNNYYKNYLKQNEHVYIAVVNNNIIGFLDGFIINDNVSKTKAKIKALYVIKEYRNKHVATSLINNFINVAKTYNCDNIEINVISDNEVAKSLYQKLKFKTFSESLRLKL